jgi:hypothetical protein
MIADEGGPLGSGSVLLNESGETDAPIISGEAPREASFVVPYDGLFGLEFRNNGSIALRLEIVCEGAAVPAKATSASAPTDVVVQRHEETIIHSAAKPDGHPDIRSMGPSTGKLFLGSDHSVAQALMIGALVRLEAIEDDSHAFNGRMENGNAFAASLGSIDIDMSALSTDGDMGGRPSNDVVARQATMFARLSAGATTSHGQPQDADLSAMQDETALERFDGALLDNAALTGASGTSLEAGMLLGKTEGLSISASGTLEGIGQENAGGWSGRLSIKAPLN